MRRRTVAAAGLTAATVALGLAAGAPAAGPNPATAPAIGSEAYDYGFPLLEFNRVRREMTSVACPDHKGNAPANSFSNAKKFADATVRVVVAPNTDTLYSIAHLNLRKGPITLTHPNMGKRYYGFELLDPYTNVIDIPGQRKDGGAKASWKIRWQGGKSGRTKAPRADRVIRSKYPDVWVIGRTLAKGKRDRKRAYGLMKRYRLLLPNGKPRKFAKGCKPGKPAEYPTPTDGAGFSEALGKALVRYPPPKRDDPFLTKVAPYGIGPGTTPADAGLDPATLTALYGGISAEAAALPTAVKLHAFTESQKTHGWYLPPANIGRYGTDYTTRAQIASAGLGANTPQEAIYPVGVGDGNGALYAGANDYRLTFPKGEQPPAKYFWSLTMYDADGYLVDNPIDRYSVGPTHPPLAEKKDGSVVVAIQRSEPSEKNVNWLPAPAGQFRLNLRLYGPSKKAIKGAWIPPGVENLGPAVGS